MQEWIEKFLISGLGKIDPNPRVLLACTFASFGTIILFTLKIPGIDLIFLNAYGIAVIFLGMLSTFFLIMWLLTLQINYIRTFLRERKAVQCLDRLTTRHIDLLNQGVKEERTLLPMVKRHFFAYIWESFYNAPDHDPDIDDLYRYGIVIMNPDEEGWPGIIHNYVLSDLKEREKIKHCVYRRVIYKLKRFFKWLLV